MIGSTTEVSDQAQMSDLRRVRRVRTYKRLESLRGLAAVMVIFYHSPYTYGRTPLGINRNAYLFVDLFFVLSGFVMSHAYSERVAGGLRFKHYIIARLGRIYPLHFAMLLAWVPFVIIKAYLYRHHFGMTDPLTNSNLATFVTNVLLIHAWHLHRSLSWNFPSWTISAEFAAYLLFFLWVRAFGPTVRGVRLIACSFAAYATLAIINSHSLDFTSDYGVLRCLAGFWLGMAVYRFRRETAVAIPHMDTICVVVCCVLITYSDSSLVALHCVPLVFAALVFVAAADDGPHKRSVLLWPWFRNVGTWSYSVYMVNGLVMGASINIIQYVVHVDSTQPLGILAVLLNAAIAAVIIALATVTYRFIEVPGKALATRLRN